MTIDEQPSARALRYAHDVRWPDSRIDLARLCEQYGDELVRERDAEIARLTELVASVTTRANTEIARLRASPGADAMSRASRVWYTEIYGKPQLTEWAIATYTRALQQYGDERAAEAREAAIEDAKQAASWAIHDIELPATAEGNLELRTRVAQTVMAAIGTLAAKPGSAG